MTFTRNTAFLLPSFLYCMLQITAYSQSPSDITAYIEQYTQIALEQEQLYGIPAPITLAQGILESAAGKSKLTLNTNNHFGIKALGGWTGPVYYAWDDEPVKSRFRKYSSAEESFRDHSLVLKNSSRYNSLFQKSVFDYRAWAIGLQNAGYATAPNYAKALIGYIDAYAIYSVNGGVKLRPGKKVIISAINNNTYADCQMDESEVSEEQEEISSVISRYVVEINGVRCAILYPGKTLSSISQQYDIPQQKLLKYNEVNKASDIHEGDVVFLEQKNKKYSGIHDYYVVKEGDTPHSISQKYGIRLSCLLKMNGKTPFSSISIGEKLMLK